MGRRKPAALQKGDLTVRVQKQKELEEQSIFIENDQLQIPPTWLINSEATNEWIRLVKEFDKKSMINNLDYNNLGAYCNAFAKYTEIVEKLGMDIMIGINVNPLVQMELKYAEEMRKFASLLGLTSESRLKLGSIVAGVTSNEVENRFGEI